MIGSIYTLRCPKSGNIIYVGMTTIILKYRLSQHMHSASRFNAPIYKYIRGNSITPIIELVEEVNVYNRNDLLAIESYWIDQFRQWGFQLYNETNNKRIIEDLEHIHDVAETYTTVKINKKVMDNVRKFVSKSGVSISAFFEIAAEERFIYLKQIKDHNKQL